MYNNKGFALEKLGYLGEALILYFVHIILTIFFLKLWEGTSIQALEKNLFRK